MVNIHNIDVSNDIIEATALIDSILDQYQKDPAAIGTDHYKMKIYNTLQLSRALLVQYKGTYESIQKVMEMI